MTISRHQNDSVLNFGTNFGSPQYLTRVRNLINSGQIPIENQLILNEEQRLDILAGQFYGNSRYWWIIAIASGIGYGLQVPPGTIITVPNLNSVLVSI
jgi:hypothetical protein